MTESRRPSGETRRGEDAETEQQAAVDEVTEQKKKVAAASLARADAAADVWTSSGEAVEARENAAKFRGDADQLTREAGEAESSRTDLLEEERGLRETAGTATAKQQTAEGRAETHKEAEGQKRTAADEALAKEREFTQQAKKAEEERAAAEARVAEFTKQAKEAREKQEAAEARVAALMKQAKEAEEKQKAAEAAAQGKAAAEDDALQQAAQAEAEAEAEDKVAKNVKKWADAAANALRQAGEAALEAHRRAGDADGADTARTTAEGDQQELAETWKSAQEQATAARNQAAVWAKEAETAAKEHTKARNEAAEHGKDAAAAQQQADTDRDQAAGFADTARQKREAADSARGMEQQQADIAAGAQRRAAAAAQTQLEQGAAETAATTALTARRAAAKKAANEAAEAVRKTTAEAGEQTDESGPADAERADEAGGSLRKDPKRAVKAVGHAAKKTAAKVKPWVDPPDTATLRGSAPIGGALLADASKTGDTGRMDGAVIQQHVENPINTISDVTGAVNDVVALKDAAGKRGESGPASHAHRKDWRGKPLGLLTNVLMSVNDGVKVAGSSLRTVKNMAPVAALGDAGGALTILFSSVIAARDAMVIKGTRARRRALKKHFNGTAAKRVAKLQGVLDELGIATTKLAQESATLTASSAGPGAEDGPLPAVEIDGLRRVLLGHMASLREYAVDKKKRKLAHRAANLGGNGARIAAGAVAIAAASGAISGPVGPAVAGGLTAAALGGYAAKKGAKKVNKRYISVRQPERYARTTPAQEGTKEPEAPRMSKDGKGGSKRDAWKEAVTVTHSIKQGKRQLRAQEVYALAAGPAVPAGKNVPKDIREDMREFLKTLKCGPDDHKQSYKDWEASLNDPEQQTEWEEAIAKQLASV